jgi:zinc transport system ATP-binding protein
MKDSVNALEIRGHSVSYGGVNALQDINLVIKKGDFTAVIGPNGGGKSTLLRASLGLIPIESGEIKLLGKKPADVRSKAGYVPQFSYLDKRFPMTVFETVLTGRLSGNFKPFKRYSDQDKDITSDKLIKTGMDKLAERKINELSGGEFQKVLIARALASEPEIMFLDEPTANVDASAREHIYALMGELNKTVTVIMVTHDLFAVSSEVKSIACLNIKLVYHGEPELNENILGGLYGCPVDLIAHGVPHRVLGGHGEKHV